MIVKTFSGPSLRDALDNVRKAFGEDAVIIDTQFEAPSTDRADSNRGVRVTAAYEPDSSNRPSVEGPRSLTLVGELAETRTSPVETPDHEDSPTDDSAEDIPEEPNSTSTTDIISEISRRLSSSPLMVANGSIRGELSQWLSRQPRLAGEVIDAYATDLAESLPPFGPFLERDKSPLRVLLVGPRGVGRSNAMFKTCAASWKCRQTKPGLLVVSDAPVRDHESLDSICRSCGLELLRESTENGKFSLPRSIRKADVYAEFVPSSTTADLTGHARSAHKSCRPDVVVLVISATQSPDQWHRILERFAAFEPTHLIVTHWDEHEPWYDLAAFVRQHQLSASYRISGSDLFDEITPFTETDFRNGISDTVAAEFAPRAQTSHAKGETK